MYRTVLLVLYLMILIPSLTHLVRNRDYPTSRRWSVGLGVVGVLLAPSAASFLCSLVMSVLSIGLYILVILGGIGMLLKSVFR